MPRQDIRPFQSQRVMDLIEAAGLDVSDWANYARGQENPAANPRYCYEWAFVGPEVVVLCIWFENLDEQDGVIFQSLNVRDLAVGNTPAAARARRFDLALQRAWRDVIPLRVIVCSGLDEDRNNGQHVQARLLDPQPWGVTAYDMISGNCSITRNPAKECSNEDVTPGGQSADRTITLPFVDQFSAQDIYNETRTRHTEAEIYVRNADVRSRVLKRADGQCELCGLEGFRTPDDRIYLETHHAIPLSEGGADSDRNVIALCANHHREAHYGGARGELRQRLIEILQTSGD